MKIFTFVFYLIVFFAPISTRPEPSSQNAELDLKKASSFVIGKTNVFRKEHDLDSLETNETLQQAAQSFANYMAENDKYGHHADGRSPAERVTAAGYDYCVVRENIAYRKDARELDTKKLAELFTQGWIDSPPHRENMLADFTTDTSVAIATTDGKTFYAVQLFGRPKAKAYRVTLTNKSEKSWTVEIESNGGSDEIDVAPRSTLTMRRCFPIGLSIPETNAHTKIDSTAELMITVTQDGPQFSDTH